MKKLISALALLLPTTVGAQAVTEWGRPDGWRLFKDATGGCAMTANYPNAKVTIAASNAYPGKAVIAISNPSWHSLQLGEVKAFNVGGYALQGRVIEDITARGVMLAALTDLTALMSSIGSDQPLKISVGTETVAIITRQLNAAHEFSRCANSMGDPFAR
ncbi:hypothetical protein LAV_00134 [Sphingobium phage Lacusarx]|uniref:Invasion associated locus B (IalB) protein n=1 Tax=Sphingobium phage Lacusarx TaxID=1980139 RepID=A0A1W6DX98_9CAUD|nr:hypothetical protein FDH44_gp169 [Sphingobium phage Lacusarx]ARK07509.1 hypothetical protein LAV_00134 [Sphingobium phage Lacusarx]